MKVGFYGGKFNIVHLGHVRAMLEAYSQVDKLYIMVMFDEEYEKARYEKLGIPIIEPYIRQRWWTQITKDLDNVEVHTVYNKNTNDFKDWERASIEVKEIISEGLTHVFSTVPAYEDYFKKLYPNTEIVTMEQVTPCSATQIFEKGVLNSWEYIPNEVRPYFNKKVVFLGSESSGKSTMTKKVAKYFNTNYVEEQGSVLWQFYGGKLGKVFSEKDYLDLTYQQKAIEFKKLQESNKFLAIDTETIVTETWLKWYEETENKLLSEISKSEDYDLFIIISPTREFVQDGMRNFKENSQRYDIFKDMLDKLVKYNKNYIVIDEEDSGKVFAKCITEITKILK